MKLRDLLKSLSLSIIVLFVTPLDSPASFARRLHPNVAAGASNDRLMDRTEWDAVNLFNGNLNLSIPLGINYPLTQSFGYQLSLNYNSAIWDFDQNTLSASPNKYFNAGLGWELSFGRLIDPSAADNGLGRWLYISPDAAEHQFFDTLHTDVAEPNGDNVYYTRDGTYLRLKQVDSSTCILESPDGRIRTFLLSNGVWVLSKISDRFSNFLKFDYATSNVWTLTDNYGRRQVVYFKSDASGFYPGIVDRIVLSAFGGSTATYSFAYTTGTVTRPTFAGDPNSAVTVNVPLLTSITFPDGSSQVFTYYPAGASFNSSGRISSMQLPTLGKIQWTYQTYAFTSPGCPTSLPSLYQNTTGVATRTLVDALGVSQGAWTYTPSLNPSGTEERELRNTLTTPLKDKTIYYFSVNYQATDPGTGWSRLDYALPGTKNQLDATGMRYLAQQYFDCDSSGNNCQLLRSVFVRYEQDIADPSAWPTEIDTSSNRRQASQRTLYNDDVENGVTRFADINRSKFDGLGNYREVDTDGNFGSGDVHQTSVNYDAVNGTYPSANYTPFAAPYPWVINTHTQFKEVEDQSAQVADRYFDRATGRLLRQRRWQSTNPVGTVGSYDVVTSLTWDSFGQLSKEQYFGADIQPIETGSLSSISLPPDQYQIRYNYQFGVENGQQYVDNAGNVFGPKIVDRDIDLNTGLVATERDSAGVTTQYTYDGMGRLTWIKPDNSQGLFKEIRYIPATGTGASSEATTATYQYRASDGSCVSADVEFEDSFGRIFKEQTWMPDNSHPIRYRHYNALGWLIDQSEFSNQAPRYTSYLNYDPFGRVRLETAPDGPQHNIIYEYVGVRSRTKKAQVGLWYDASGQVVETQRSTTEIYDRQGRLWQDVVHPQNPTSQDNITISTYDVAGRLVQSTNQGILVGNRYAYDGRGFLFRVSDANNVGPYYQNFDAMGNARKQRPSSTDLTYVFDRASRLTSVRDAVDSSKVWKEFSYADTNGPNDWRAGKLWTSKRYNYLPNSLPSVITETYTYSGLGGRISQYEIDLTDGVHQPEMFTQTYSYNAWGDVKALGYPNSIAVGSGNMGRARTITNSYLVGRLTNVVGTLNSQNESWAPSIIYDGNGLVNQVMHGNGVADNTVVDSNGFVRPSSIYTSGVKQYYGQPDQNYYSGPIQYDGLGSPVRIGLNYFVPSQSAQGGDDNGPFPIAGCQPSLYDSLGQLSASMPDSSCAQQVFYFYNASDVVVRTEDRRPQSDLRTWRFFNSEGSPLTQYKQRNTTGNWLSTLDYIYRGRVILATQETLPGAFSPTTKHYHPAYGVGGILTDQYGYRTQ